MRSVGCRGRTNLGFLLSCRGAGPGNNGGDGLVAARHLGHFGARPTIYYPKPTPRAPFEACAYTPCGSSPGPLALTLPAGLPIWWRPQGLVRQNQQLGTPFVASVDAADLERHYDVVVDAVFGFSFKSGGIRAPFDTLLAALRSTKVPVAAIDIPSGWDVERGDVDHVGVRPAALISLTAPKLCARYLEPSVRHILAGRFVPPYAAWARGA